MPPIVSMVNLKGGVGKTAIAVNFAAYCGRGGLRTLLVDMDPQTNATFSCIRVEEWERHARTHGTVANLLGHRRHTRAEDEAADVADVIRHQVFQGVDLIPSHLDLFTVDLDLASAAGREIKLRRSLEPILDEYDVVVCDCPPNLTIPTQNALAASTHFVVPISPDYLSGLGVGILLRRVRNFCDDIQHKLDLAGMVISRVGRPAQHRTETVNALRTRFGEDVLKTQITERVAVSAAAAANQPIFEQGDSAATAEFAGMSAELLDRLGLDGGDDENA